MSSNKTANTQKESNQNRTTLPHPSSAKLQLLSPDGYYTFLQLTKQNVDIDPVLLKKNYRKLSLRHHPDKPGGDAETFRMLNRAQTVLGNPKLKEQYDILGLDLDDDDDDDEDNNVDGQDHASSANSSTGGGGGDRPSTSQGIVHEIASMALTSVLQLGVRTLMMAFVSLVICRFLWTLIPALAFLAYIAVRIASTPTAGTLERASPFLLGTGLMIMYHGSSSSSSGFGWWFWLGESLVIAMFTFNSMGTAYQHNPPPSLLLAIIGIVAALLGLFLRGKFWNYAMVLGLELFLALFIALAFPVLEMVLEAVLNDKLKKVGDKVRAHHKALEAYYRELQQQQE